MVSSSPVSSPSDENYDDDPPLKKLAVNSLVLSGAGVYSCSVTNMAGMATDSVRQLGNRSVRSVNTFNIKIKLSPMCTCI